MSQDQFLDYLDLTEKKETNIYLSLTVSLRSSRSPMFL